MAQIRVYVTRESGTAIIIPNDHPKRIESMLAVAAVLNVPEHYQESDEVRNAVKLDGSEMDQHPAQSDES